MSLALTRSNRNHSSLSRERNMRSTSDRALQESIAAVEKSKNDFVELNNYIRHILDLPTNRAKSWFAKGLNFLIPKRFYPKLPNMLVKLIAEELDALEATEGVFRTKVNNIQMGVKDLTHAIKQKGAEIETLRSDFEQAQEKNWNARELHEYMLDKAGLEVDEEIAELLDDKFNVLSEKEKESRKQRLLQQLERNVSQGRSLVVVGVKACYAGLEVFEAWAGEYYNFVSFYKPLAAIRNSAETMIEGAQVMYASRDALASTFDVSVHAIENALEAVRKCKDYSIVSADMQKLLETGNKKIDDKLKLLAGEDQKRISGLAPAQIATAKIIDIQPSAN